MIKVILNTQLNGLLDTVNENIIKYLNHHQINKFESYEDLILISFNGYDIHNPSGMLTNLKIIFTKEDLFFICEDESYAAKIRKLIPYNKCTEKTLHEFFSGLIRGDINFLEAFEERITQTEDELLSTTKAEYAQEIILFRRELLKLKKYYEELNEIFEDLIEDEYTKHLISREELRYYKNIHNKIDRLISYVHSLRDYVTQAREAYQAQIDIEQNHLMKIFTVITAIFLPLTLIVGWYGMNLKMPEFEWVLGYPFVILLSLSIVFLCIIYFKRKKWF